MALWGPVAGGAGGLNGQGHTGAGVRRRGGGRGVDRLAGPVIEPGHTLEPGVHRPHGGAAGRAAGGDSPLLRAGSRRLGAARGAGRRVRDGARADRRQGREGPRRQQARLLLRGRSWPLVPRDRAAAGHRRLCGWAAHPDLPARAAHPLGPADRHRIRRGHRRCAVLAYTPGRNRRPQWPAAEGVGAGRAGAAPGDRIPGGATHRPGHATRGPGPVPQGALAASCATAAAALLLAVLTSVTIALFPHHVPLLSPTGPAVGPCV